MRIFTFATLDFSRNSGGQKVKASNKNFNQFINYMTNIYVPLI